MRTRRSRTSSPRSSRSARTTSRARSCAPAPPTHIALLVDDSQVAQQAVADLRTALASFVKKMFAGAEGLQMSYDVR